GKAVAGAASCRHDPHRPVLLLYPRPARPDRLAAVMPPSPEQVYNGNHQRQEEGDAVVACRPSWKEAQDGQTIDRCAGRAPCRGESRIYTIQPEPRRNDVRVERYPSSTALLSRAPDRR